MVLALAFVYGGRARSGIKYSFDFTRYVNAPFTCSETYSKLETFPILVIILGYGSQIEKINSSYYLIFYAAFCSFPFLFVYFKSNFLLVFTYYNFIIS